MSRDRRAMPRDDHLRAVVLEALEHGCTLEQQGRSPHKKLVLPDGRRVPIGGGRSVGPIAAARLRRQLERRGVELA